MKLQKFLHGILGILVFLLGVTIMAFAVKTLQEIAWVQAMVFLLGAVLVIGGILIFCFRSVKRDD